MCRNQVYLFTDMLIYEDRKKGSAPKMIFLDHTVKVRDMIGILPFVDEGVSCRSGHTTVGTASHVCTRLVAN